MIKIIIAAILSLSALSANAGFVTGAIVGAVIGSASTSGAAPQQAQSIAVTSDKNNVIICQPTLQGSCAGVPITKTYTKTGGYKVTPELNPSGCNVIHDSFASHLASLVCTPEQYAKLLGYKTLHKVGAVISGPNTYIIMEVSK